MNKYEICYFQCSTCNFIQTENPFWLEEAYNSAITNSDIGMMQRNLTLKQFTQAIIQFCFYSGGRFLDYGGGYGIFVRMMRDTGFDFSYYDAYCENIFAKGFEGSLFHENYEMITAFEVFEHLANPYEDIEKMLNVSDSILFTTELLPVCNPKPEEWWYYGLEHGQHISFFTHKSLREIAIRYGLNLYSNGSSLHLLSKRKISPLFQMVSNYKVAYILNIITRKKSLLEKDYNSLTCKKVYYD